VNIMCEVVDIKHRARIRPPKAAPKGLPKIPQTPKARMSLLLGPCLPLAMPGIPFDPFMENMKRLDSVLNPPWLRKLATAHALGRF